MKGALTGPLSFFIFAQMKFLKRVGRILLKAIFWFVVVSVLWVVLYRFINPPVTYVMLERYVEMEDGRINKDWKDIEEISPHMQLAVVAAEDQTYMEHWGFDMKAIEEAFENNEKGGRLRGGSTISQQTAKNVFLWHGRSWVRKGLEAWFTTLVELIWGKERILEVYLNVIELGPGLYGVEAAGQEYFNKPASKLSRSQAALLAAVLPSPRKYSVAKPTPYIWGRQKWIQGQMWNLGDPLNFHRETEK